MLVPLNNSSHSIQELCLVVTAQKKSMRWVAATFSVFTLQSFGATQRGWAGPEVGGDAAVNVGRSTARIITTPGIEQGCKITGLRNRRVVRM